MATGTQQGSVGDDPGADDRARRWAPTEGRIGISCSGGGVRSASFCLGGLQALREAGILPRASYVSAVSGGSYIAVGHAIANGPPVESPFLPPALPIAERRDPPPWAPGSPEEDALRAHSSTIAPTSRVALRAVLRLLNGLGINIVLLVLVSFVLARPAGWLAGWVHPELRARPGAVDLVGLRSADLDLRHPVVVLAVVLCGLGWVAYLLRLLLRPLNRRVRLAIETAGRWTGLAGVAIAIPTLVLPLALRHLLPRIGLVPTIPGQGPITTAVAPAAAASGGGSKLEAVPYVLAAAGAGGSAVLAWVRRTAVSRRRTLLPLLPAFVLPVVGAIVVLQQAAYGAANGPTGRLTGFGLGAFGPSDVVRWVLAVAFLAVFALVVDAHAWSLHPFYKARLNEGYAVQRRVGGKAMPVEYWGPELLLSQFGIVDRPVSAPAPSGEPGQVGWPADLAASLMGDVAIAGEGPQLVVCAAANIIEDGFAPPGRNAVSFTFSSTEVGGPDVGYVATADLEDLLPERRLRDLTVLAATAVSGAAVSPGMGTETRGSLGRLLALLNIRLGIWLPNPKAVQKAIREDKGWWDRPGWPWFVCELLGRFSSDARYLYVSDGGHWENLGLVELLRRGCTDVWCLSAAGDGIDRFTTLGQAFALARADLGIDVQIDLSPLRAGSAPEDQHDPLAAAKRLSRRGWAEGSLLYPNGTRGRLIVVETALTADLPWALRAYGEATDDFPDVSTGDQLFDHQQFEAYRALGHHQVHSAVLRR